MDVTRRHFLAFGQWLAVAAALPSKVFGASLLTSFGKAGKTRLSSFTMQTFVPLVNSSFPVDTGSTTTTWLTLLSVEDTTQAPATNLETYTAIFNHILTSQTLPHPPIRRVGTGQSFIQQGGEAPAELNQTPGATGSPAQVERNPRSGANPRIPR